MSTPRNSRRSMWLRFGAIAVGAMSGLVFLAFPDPTPAPTCPGDCNGDGSVTINELLTGVRIALDDLGVESCEAMDPQHDGHVEVTDLVVAVQAALTGCPMATLTPTPTATPPPEATAGTGIRTVRLTVETIDGTPVDGFSARFDERGERTSSSNVTVEHGAVLTYIVKNTAAAVVVLVSADGFYASVNVLDPPADLDNAATSEPVQARLVPKGRCLKVSDACVGQVANGQFVPGEVIVGVDEWLWPDEANAVLEPYCQLIDGIDPEKTVSMWVDVVQGDPQAAIAALKASGLVQFADVRGYDGGPVTGTPLLVAFEAQVGINAARDVLDSVNGVHWLQTVLNETVATVHVDPGHEAEWACELKRDANLAYASLNNIITAP